MITKLFITALPVVFYSSLARKSGLNPLTILMEEPVYRSTKKHLSVNLSNHKKRDYQNTKNREHRQALLRLLTIQSLTPA